MKLMYINAFYSPDIGGGAEITLKILVEGMQARGHEVVVVATTVQGNERTEIINGVKVHRIPIANLYWHFGNPSQPALKKLEWHWRDVFNKKMAHAVKKIIVSENPDVISCHNLPGFSVSVWPLIKNLNKPLVQVLHDLYLMCPRGAMYKNKRPCVGQCYDCKLFRLNHAAYSSNVDAVVGVSKFVLNRLVGHGFFRNSEQFVVNNARNIPRKDRIKEISSDSVVFGYIGRLTENKGVEWLVDSFKNVGGGCQLIIAGNGDEDYVSYLKNMAEGENISFLGYVSPEHFFELIDVCVIPSLWPDTFPGVAFESLAYGVPVISTKLGGLPEIVQNEKNGVLVDHFDKGALLHAMRRLVNDINYIRLLSAGSRDTVDNLTNVDRQLNEYEAIYLKMIKEGK